MAGDAARRIRATTTPDGAVALTWNGKPLVAACLLAVARAETGQRWAFGAGDPGVQHQTDGGLAGWRIVRDGLDARLTFGLPPDGNAAVFRLDTTNAGADEVTLVLESVVDAAGGGAWEDVAVLHARTVRVVDGLWLAQTFVPDDGRMPGNAVETPHGSVSTSNALRRIATVAAGKTQGWTVCVGVGATAKAALGAVFPHLSGQRSRAALVAAKSG